MKTYARTAFAAAPLLLLLACSSNTPPATTYPEDLPPNASANNAQFDPSKSVIPLPNILLTGAVTAPVVPVAKVPLTPDKTLAWINQNEVGGTHAVSGLSSAIYITFDKPVTRSSVAVAQGAPASIKIFMALPDSDGTENLTLGFRDVSSLFTPEFVKNSSGLADAGVLLHPMLPLPPGSRFVYVVTQRVIDATTGLAVRSALPFYYLKYQKPLTDLTDPENPAAWMDASSRVGLESIRSNVMSGTNILLSGYAKTMANLVANGAADTSSKAAAGAGATGITKMDDIRLIGRFITSGAMVTRLVADTASTQAPIETALWMWANNAPGTGFASAGARAWNNGITSFTPLGSSSVADPAPGSIGYFFSNLPAPLNGAPRNAIGFVAAGAYESGDLNIDPAILAGVATKPPSGKLDGVAGATDAYWPGHYGVGTDVVPGTGILQGARPDGKTLTGYYHVTRMVPFVLLVPATPAPTGGYPVLIAQHGVGGQKEQMLAMANTACAAGYAVVAIDQPLHGGSSTTGKDTFLAGVTAMGNGRPAAEWGNNFISLASIINTRTNVQQAGFNLWRLERILKQPAAADPTSLQAAMAAVGKPLSTTGANNKFVGISLGSIVGAYFLAGNSAQTGGSNMKGLLSVPGARLPYILRDSPTFGPAISAGLAASGVATGSSSYHQFFVLAQSIADVVDPSWATTPIGNQASGLPLPSRLSGRVLVQEAIGDVVIPNTYGRFFGNAIGGRGIMGTGFDIAPGFAQVRFAAATAPTVPFMLALANPPLKASLAPSTDPATGPSEGYFQYGTLTSPATHGMLLDGAATDPANNRGTALVQKQMAMWLATGKVIDPIDVAHWPQAGLFSDEGRALQAFPMHYPQ